MSNNDTTNAPVTVTDEADPKSKPSLKERLASFRDNHPTLSRVTTECAAGCGYAVGFVATVVAVGAIGSLFSSDDEELEEDED